jgi:hypothetical protein
MKLVYKFAAAAPHENSDLVAAQMRLGHKYRNTLTEIERGRRAAVRAAETEIGDMSAARKALSAAVAEVDLAMGAIARHRAHSRKRDEPAEMRQAFKTAKAAKKAAADAFREVRDKLRLDPGLIDAKDAIGERANELRASARGYSGLGEHGPHYGAWGTYLLVEKAAGDSFKSIALYDKRSEPADPSFARWVGESSVGVQLQGGLAVADAVNGADTQVRITLPDARAWDRRGRTHRECEQFARQAQLSIRIGSDGRRPVWASWRVDMHRPLPDGAVLKEVAVHCRKEGPFSKWFATFTLDAPAKVRGGSCAGSGTVAVDVGWRVMGDELRVAGWQDATGARGELRLSAKDLALLRAPEALRSQRDLRFDVARGRVNAWLRANSTILPDWLRLASANIHAWRAESRLAGLHGRWRGARFGGDVEIYDVLSNWASRARHDWAVESQARGQALRRRREKYRVWAAQLATRYDTIVIEKFDKRKVAKRPDTDAQCAQTAEQIARDEYARAHRVLASTSELCGCLVDAGRSRQSAVLAMPCADTTRTCPTCGLVESRDAAASVSLTCDCGAAWDQDVDGAPSILLARWRERPGDAQVLAGAREDENANENGDKKESRWERASRMRDEKLARMATARAMASNGA